ncbi:hypothetical protein C8A05DRAFT_44087 [Staphylotrichum tortipilum]|uniref:Rhodopsin domain-containing protein n=1 Tax=Staphylotrichum tortipilum TaxID=2831512 RepID=A0AAN6RUF8_9PEZI|nr:hypothetical protein C8A05DRAFT_44087 [Staphylotrichum longicolle]
MATPTPAAPIPVATGAATDNTTIDPMMFTGMPISPRAAYLARIHIGATAVLLFLCLVTFSTRMYQRIRPVWKVGLDDYFICLGFLLSIVDCSLLYFTMYPQPTIITLEQSTAGGKNSWIAIGIWGLAMTCIKISIALTLLRIQGKERGWRIFLYTLMAIQTIYGVGNVFFNLVIACRPLEAAWTPFMPGCVSTEVMSGVSNTGSAINITTDVLLSLSPATFLRKLNRPLRERIFVCVLMGMGLFASISSIVKTVIIIRDWSHIASLPDFWATSVSICTWTAMEQLLGVLAACVPAMKGIFQECLGAVGVSLTENKTHRSGYYKHNDTGPLGGSRTGGDPTTTFRSLKGDEGTFSRRGKEMYDDEEIIDLPDMSRNDSAGSIGERSAHPQTDSRGHSVEQLPAHAV